VRRSTRHIGMVAAFALSALFIYLAFRDVEWVEMARALGNANHGLVLLGAAVGLAGFIVRAFGWKFLLVPVGRMSGWHLFPPVAIGYMANNLLPARLGEFARAYVVGKQENVSKSAALATILVERIFDGLTLLMILAAVSLFFPYPPWVKDGGLIVAVIFVGLSIFLAVISIKVSWGLRMMDVTLGRFLPDMAERMKSRLLNFVVGLDLKNHFRTSILAFGCVLFRWAFEACIYLSVLYAMGLQDLVPLHGALFVMVAVNIACMVPQAPGFVGSVQLACIESLAVFGVDREVAAAYSLLVHAAFFFPITLAGIVCLLRSRFSFAEIRKSRNSGDTADLATDSTMSSKEQETVA
jgi:uncharacterized protein (TIRG00374 family)